MVGRHSYQTPELVSAVADKGIAGADRGAKPSLRVLAVTSASSRELASDQFSAATAITGTCCLSMVRRRSTVRFRKGAPRSETKIEQILDDQLVKEWGLLVAAERAQVLRSGRLHVA